MTPERLARKFGELGQQLVRLPDTEEPPPTTLLNLGWIRRQDDRRRLLANFLTPDRSHGLGHSVTEQFLQGLSTRDDIDFEFSLFDLEDVEVATELLIQDGCLDLVV